jgi:hypothetical protein
MTAIFSARFCRQHAPVTSLNILAVILFAVAILGFAQNWKDTFARICGFWILFSLFVSFAVNTC